MNAELLTAQLASLIEADADYVPALANASALLNGALDDINWVGFYLMDRGSLVVGPFQGGPACVRIPVGKGVCGTAVLEDHTQRVEDVHAFSGHIACDSRSRSEIVIPIHKDGVVVGVLDIDSPSLSRFDEQDAEDLRRVVGVIEAQVDFSRLRLA